MRSLRSKKKISVRERLENVGYRRHAVDPDLRKLLVIMKNSGKSKAAVERESGVTTSTQRRWERGLTKRPQNLTLTFAGRAHGYERKWVRIEK